MRVVIYVDDLYEERGGSVGEQRIAQANEAGGQ